MKFATMDYMHKNMYAAGAIEQFKRATDCTEEDMPAIIALLEDLGVEIDACSNCGEMPMTTNCNNANCS